MKKKLVTASLLTLCAIALVVASVLTTIALLTSSSSVSNVFTVGDVKISMYESKVNSAGKLVDAKGEVIGENGERVKVDTNSYHLIPGETYIKDPTIYITTENDADEMYLFVKSRNEIRSAEAGNFAANPTDTLTMREQMHANGWVEYVRSGDGVEIVWVYGTRNITSGEITPIPVNKTSRQKDGAPAGEFRLCESFTIHQDATVALYGAAQVTFTGFAIQSKGFAGDSNSDHALTYSAWEAIKGSFPIDFSIVNPKNPYSNEEGVDAYAPVMGVESPVEIPGTTTNPGN